MAVISNTLLMKTFNVHLAPYSTLSLCWALGVKLNKGPVGKKFILWLLL